MNAFIKRSSGFGDICFEVPDLALYDDCCIYEKHTIVCVLAVVYQIPLLHSKNILSYDFVFLF